jgi:hypothetical protein
VALSRGSAADPPAGLKPLYGENLSVQVDPLTDHPGRWSAEGPTPNAIYFGFKGGGFCISRHALASGFP